MDPLEPTHVTVEFIQALRPGAAFAFQVEVPGEEVDDQAERLNVQADPPQGDAARAEDIRARARRFRDDRAAIRNSTAASVVSAGAMRALLDPTDLRPLPAVGGKALGSAKARPASKPAKSKSASITSDKGTVKITLEGVATDALNGMVSGAVVGGVLAGLVATFEQAADCYEGKQTKRGAIKIVLKSTGWGIVIGGALGAAIAAGLAMLSTSGAAVVAAAAGVYSGKIYAVNLYKAVMRFFRAVSSNIAVDAPPSAIEGPRLHLALQPMHPAYSRIVYCPVDQEEVVDCVLLSSGQTVSRSAWSQIRSRADSRNEPPRCPTTREIVTWAEVNKDLLAFRIWDAADILAHHQPPAFPTVQREDGQVDLAPRIYTDRQGNSVANPVPGVVRNIMLEQVVEKWTDHIANCD